MTDIKTTEKNRANTRKFSQLKAGIKSPPKASHQKGVLKEQLKNMDTLALVKAMDSSQTFFKHIHDKIAHTNPAYWHRLTAYLHIHQQSKIPLSHIIPANEYQQSRKNLTTLKAKQTTYINDFNLFGFTIPGVYLNRSPLPLNQSPYSKLTILHGAIIDGDKTWFDYIIKAITRFENKHQHLSTKSNYCKKVGHLNLDIKDVQGMTPLHHLAQQGLGEWAPSLLSAYPFDENEKILMDVSQTDNLKRNVLHHAVLAGNKASLATLCSAADDFSKADWKALAKKDMSGFTPLELAIKLKRMDIACLLIEKGAFQKAVVAQHMFELCEHAIKNHDHARLNQLISIAPIKLTKPKAKDASANPTIEAQHERVVRARTVRMFHMAIESINSVAVLSMLHVLDAQQRSQLCMAQRKHATPLEHLERARKTKQSKLRVQSKKIKALSEQSQKQLQDLTSTKTSKSSISKENTEGNKGGDNTKGTKNHSYDAKVLTQKIASYKSHQSLLAKQAKSVKHQANRISKILKYYEVSDNIGLIERTSRYQGFMGVLKDELVSTNSYRNLSWLARYQAPASALLASQKATGSLVMSALAGIHTYYQGSWVDWGQSSLRAFSTLFDHESSIRRIAQSTNELISLYRRTPHYVASKVVQGSFVSGHSNAAIQTGIQGISSALGLTSAHHYLNYREGASALFFACDRMLGEQYLYPYLESNVDSLEKIATGTFDIKTLDEYSDHLAQQTNDGFYELTGIEPRASYYKSLQWIRRHIAGLEGDDADESLTLLAMTPDELDNHLTDELEKQLQNQIKPLLSLSSERLAQTAMHQSVGQQDKVQYIADFLALAIIQQEHLHVHYEPEAYQSRLEGLKYTLKSQVEYSLNQHGHCDAAAQNMAKAVDHVYADMNVVVYHYIHRLQQTNDINVVMDELMGNLHYADESKASLKSFVDYYVSYRLPTYADPNDGMKHLVNTLVSPAHDTDDFTQVVLDYASHNQHNQNLGHTVAQIMTTLLLEAKYIDSDHYQATFNLIATQTNSHYWSDQSKDKKNAHASIAKMMRFHFQASLTEEFGGPETLSPCSYQNFKDKALPYINQYNFHKVAEIGTQLIQEQLSHLALSEHELQSIQNFLGFHTKNAYKKGNGSLIYRHMLQVLALYTVKDLIEDFDKGKSLSHDILRTINQFEPRALAASYAVHKIADDLKEAGIDVCAYEQILLFDDLIGTRNDNRYEDTIFEFIDKHTNHDNLLGGISTAGYARQLQIKAYEFGENRWQGAHASETRSMSMYDHKFENLRNSSIYIRTLGELQKAQHFIKPVGANVDLNGQYGVALLGIKVLSGQIGHQNQNHHQPTHMNPPSLPHPRSNQQEGITFDTNDLENGDDHEDGKHTKNSAISLSRQSYAFDPASVAPMINWGLEEGTQVVSVKGSDPTSEAGHISPLESLFETTYEVNFDNSEQNQTNGFIQTLGRMVNPIPSAQANPALAARAYQLTAATVSGFAAAGAFIITRFSAKDDEGNIYTYERSEEEIKTLTPEGFEVIQDPRAESIDSIPEFILDDVYNEIGNQQTTVTQNQHEVNLKLMMLGIVPYTLLSLNNPAPKTSDTNLVDTQPISDSERFTAYPTFDESYYESTQAQAVSHAQNQAEQPTVETQVVSLSEVKSLDITQQREKPQSQAEQQGMTVSLGQAIQSTGTQDVFSSQPKRALNLSLPNPGIAFSANDEKIEPQRNLFELPPQIESTPGFPDLSQSTNPQDLAIKGRTASPVPIIFTPALPTFEKPKEWDIIAGDTKKDMPSASTSSFPSSNTAEITLLFNEAKRKKIKPAIWTKKNRAKWEDLPTTGKIRYIPPRNYHPTKPLHKGPNNGFYDKFDNEWVKGPSRTIGEPFEWDVQLSNQGKKQLGWINERKSHINVSLKGKITHR